MKPEHLELQARLSPEINVRLSEFVRRNLLSEPHVLSRHLAPEDLKAPFFQLVREGDTWTL